VKPFVLIAAGLVLIFGLPTLPAIQWPSVVVATPELATSAVYVYEKDESAIPVGVTVGLNRLNRERHIVATLLEADTTDGSGDVPEQYREGISLPPRLREDAVIKPIFVVPSVNEARAAVAGLSGQVNSADTEQVYAQSRYCDGFDPEGNMFQVSETA
jgi:hypothetical protein